MQPQNSQTTTDEKTSTKEDPEVNEKQFARQNFLRNFYGVDGLVDREDDGALEYEYDSQINGEGGNKLWWINIPAKEKVTESLVNAISPWAYYLCKIPEDTFSLKNKERHSAASHEMPLKSNFNEWYQSASHHLPNSNTADGKEGVPYVGLLPIFASDGPARPKFIRYTHDSVKGFVRYDIQTSNDLSVDIKTKKTPYYYDNYKASVLSPISVYQSAEFLEGDLPDSQDEDHGDFMKSRGGCGWAPCLGSSGFAAICAYRNDSGKKDDYYLVVKASPDHVIEMYKKRMWKRASEAKMTLLELLEDQNTISLHEMVQINVRRMAAQFMEVVGISIPHVLTTEDVEQKEGDWGQPNHARNGRVDVWDFPHLREFKKDGGWGVCFSKNYFLTCENRDSTFMIVPVGGRQYNRSWEGDTDEKSWSKSPDAIRTCRMLVLIDKKKDDDERETRSKAYPYLSVGNESDFSKCMEKWMKLGYNVYDHRTFIKTKTVICTFAVDDRDISDEKRVAQD